MSHGGEAVMVSNGFEVVAKSEQRAVVAVEYDGRRFYGTLSKGLLILNQGLKWGWEWMGLGAEMGPERAQMGVGLEAEMGGFGEVDFGAEMESEDKEMLANKGVFRNAYSSQESEQGVEQYSNELQNVDQQYQYAPVHEVYQKPNKCRVNKVKCLVSRRSDKVSLDLRSFRFARRMEALIICFQQLDLLEYPPKLKERLLLAIHETNEAFGFG
ncbi:hypothetical protein Tco_0502275 [Tanacetum coccineum]